MSLVRPKSAILTVKSLSTLIVLGKVTIQYKRRVIHTYVHTYSKQCANNQQSLICSYIRMYSYCMLQNFCETKFYTF